MTKEAPFSEHSRVIIRFASPDDARAIAAIYEPIVKETAVSFEFEAPDANEMRRRIADRLLTYPWLVAEADGEVLGYAYASSFRSRPAYQWSAESSVYVKGSAHRRGIGRLLYEALFQILRRQRIRIVIAGITLPNPGSVRFHEAMGFRPAGMIEAVGHKLDHDRDLGFWRLALDSAARPAGPFIALADLDDPGRIETGDSA